MVLAVTITVEVTYVLHGMSSTADSDVPIEILTSDLTVRSIAEMFLGIAGGLLACAGMCLVTAAFINRRLRKELSATIEVLEHAKATGDYSAVGVLVLDDMHAALQTVVASIQESAVAVLEEARQKQANVQELEQRVENLQTLASIAEPQAVAVESLLAKRSNLGTILTLVGIAVTIILGVWALLIA